MEGVEIIQEGTQAEIDFLKSAYAHPGEPVLWKHHEAVKKSTKGFNCYLNYRRGELNIIEMGTRDEPECFFFRVRVGGVLYASKGTVPRLAQLRDKVDEFAKMLAAMLVILSPMLLPGGGL